MSNNVAIEVKNITKSFKIPLDGANGLKQKLFNLMKGKRGYRIFTPLNNINLTIEKGEFFGIVGRNGSGKSTLLKTIAGIYNPDKGGVRVNGLLVPFIELGVGFNPDLTGRENVFLNAALLGFSRAETEAIYEDIVDFAELHEFMEEQLKNYSSGMQVRLAFSIAIRARGDILLLDEVLAVGDSSFQEKCYEYFELMKEEKKTIVLVTHNMEAVKRFCSKAMLLEKGKVKVIGEPSEVADQYSVDNLPNVSREGEEIKDSKVSLLSGASDKNEYTREEKLKLTVNYKLSEKFIPAVGMSVIRNGISVAEINSMLVDLKSDVNKKHNVHLDIKLAAFVEGTYSIDIVVFDKKTMTIISSKRKVSEFVIKGSDRVHGGAVYLENNWYQ